MYWFRTRASTLSKLGNTALLASFGPVLLLIFPSIPFVNFGFCDPWYIYGLYFNLPQLISWSPGSRQVARLTATLPGYYLKYIFPGVSLDYALFLIFYTAAVLFLYKSAALLLSRRRAALAAVFFALSPFVIGNFSATYTATGVTYEIVALYCCVRSLFAPDRRRLFAWMFVSGISWGASLHAHLAIFPFTGFIYLTFGFCILLDPRCKFPAKLGSIALGAAAVICGCAALTAALGIFAVAAFGARPSLLLDQILQVPATLEGNVTTFWRKDWYWDGSCVGMCLLAAAAAAIGFVETGRKLFGKREPTISERHSLAVTATYLLLFAALVVDSAMHDVMLQYDYLVIFLWPFLSLALFAALPDRPAAARAVPVAIFFLACLLAIMIKQYDLPTWLSVHRTGASVVIAITASVLLAALVYRPNIWFSAGYLAVLAVSMLVVRPIELDEIGYQLWTTRRTTELRHSYQRAHMGLEFLERTVGDTNSVKHVPKFWADEDGVLDAPAYARSYLWCEIQNFPDIDPEIRTHYAGAFAPGDYLVIVGRQPPLLDRARAVLARMGLAAEQIASKIITDGKGPYEILVVALSNRQHSH